MKQGQEVTARHSQCIGIIPTIWTYTGTIEKINKKSIIVSLNHMTKTFGSKVEDDREYNGSVKFNFWKSIDGREIYRSQINGIIEF